MRKLILLIGMLISFSSSYAQGISKKQMLLQKIERRDSIIDKISKKELPDSLRKQVADYHLLVDILKSESESYNLENQNLKNELHKYLILTSSDTLIFHQDFNTISNIPVCLQERINIVRSIIEFRDKIVVVESIAQELEQKYGNTSDAYKVIAEKIEKDLDEILALYHKIKDMNLSSLSDEQQKYFRPGLTDRYNNFKKYF